MTGKTPASGIDRDIVTGRLVFLLKGYPRLSETFIAQEILGLEKQGLDIDIVSLRHPTDPQIHPVHREIKAPVSYLPEYLYQEPLRVLRSWLKARKLPGYGAALRRWLGDLRRDPSPNRGRRFGQACVLAAELGSDVARLHAHFLHTPASVAYYAHLMTGVPWSCSAHAKDIWTIPDWEKREKIASLDWLVTCTQAGAEHLRGLAAVAEADKIALVHHGLDFSRFDQPAEKPAGTGTAIVILSVGRAVPKKGYARLIEALGMLKDEPNWRLRHVGGGPLLGLLKAAAGKAGIAERIEWLGAMAQAEVLAEYRRADVFVLASEVAPDGDRDGLPNVLMEAQSQRLAVVATRLQGIMELVKDEVTGLLADAGDAGQLARQLRRAIGDGGLRRRLGEAGFLRVRADFSHQRGIDDLARRFRA